MAIVEQQAEYNLSVLVWADHIEVVVYDGELVIKGKSSRGWGRPIEFPGNPENLLAHYLSLQAEVGEIRVGTRLPHVQFANARTEEELINFVRQYGPVAAHEVRINEADALGIDSLEAVQSMDVLRREHQIFAGAADILVALRQKPLDADGTLSALSRVLEGLDRPGVRIQWQNSLRAVAPTVLLDKNVLRGILKYVAEAEDLRPKLTELIGRAVFCELLNKYPPTLSPFLSRAVELPTHEPAGILPALYFMLRRDYLNEYGLQICAFTECRKFFAVERYGQRFCSAECSQLQRQRDYWGRRGKTLRRRRKGVEKKGEIGKA